MQLAQQNQQLGTPAVAAVPPAPPADGLGGVTPPPTATPAPPADGLGGVTPPPTATPAPAADGLGGVTPPAPEYVRQCLKCGEMSYFREGCCLNSKCEAWQ